MSEKKLEFVVGRKYLTRGGDVVTCFSVTNNSTYPIRLGMLDGDWFSTTMAGHCLGDNVTTPDDIVAEYTEPTATAPTERRKFRKGDVVKLEGEPKEFIATEDERPDGMILVKEEGDPCSFILDCSPLLTEGNRVILVRAAKDASTDESKSETQPASARPRFERGDVVLYKTSKRHFWVESDAFDDTCLIHIAAVDNPKHGFMANQADLTHYTEHEKAEYQPAPTPNNYPAVWSLVMRDMADRDVLGARRYGTRLQPHNGRDALLDAYQEAMDLVAYLRQAIFERDGK